MKTTPLRLLAPVLTPLVLLTACAAPPPVSSGSSQSEPASESTSPSASEPLSSAQEVPAALPDPDPAPAVELPQSIQIGQPMDNHESHWRWSLEVTAPEELTALTELLSTDYLTPLTRSQDRWPDGGTPVLIQLHYADRTVQYCTYPQEHYRIKPEENRSTLGIGEEFYAFPADRCDALLAFLTEKEAAITG